MFDPISDKGDPEAEAAESRELLRQALHQVVVRISRPIGPGLLLLGDTIGGPEGKRRTLSLTERELRLIRFGLNRALETI